MFDRLLPLLLFLRPDTIASNCTYIGGGDGGGASFPSSSPSSAYVSRLKRVAPLSSRANSRAPSVYHRRPARPLVVQLFSPANGKWASIWSSGQPGTSRAHTHTFKVFLSRFESFPNCRLWSSQSDLFSFPSTVSPCHKCLFLSFLSACLLLKMRQLKASDLI